MQQKEPMARFIPLSFSLTPSEGAWEGSEADHAWPREDHLGTWRCQHLVGGSKEFQSTLNLPHCARKFAHKLARESNTERCMIFLCSYSRACGSYIYCAATVGAREEEQSITQRVALKDRCFSPTHSPVRPQRMPSGI